MRAPLREALVSLDQEALQAGCPHLGRDVEYAWHIWERVCQEIDVAKDSQGGANPSPHVGKGRENPLIHHPYRTEATPR